MPHSGNLLVARGKGAERPPPRGKNNPDERGATGKDRKRTWAIYASRQSIASERISNEKCANLIRRLTDENVAICE